MATSRYKTHASQKIELYFSTLLLVLHRFGLLVSLVLPRLTTALTTTLTTTEPQSGPFRVFGPLHLWRYCAAYSALLCWIR